MLWLRVVIAVLAASFCGATALTTLHPTSYALDAAAPGKTRMAWGLDAAGALSLPLGQQPTYGTLWVGPWTVRWGWQAVDVQIDALRQANITPALHLYYWGDQMSPGCLEQGCDGRSVEGWQTLAQQAGEHLAGGPSIVFLETEFNKGSVATYEPLDEKLATVASILKANHPDLTVVLSFGNWNPTAWPTWDRAVAASDAVGLQAISAQTRDSAERTEGLVDATLRGAAKLTELFAKPVWLHDLAVSSWPEPGGLDVQKAALSGFGAKLADLKAAGVEAILYRSLTDTPTMDGYFGEGERHFGLAWSDGSLKPGGVALLAALRPAPAADTSVA